MSDENSELDSEVHDDVSGALSRNIAPPSATRPTLWQRFTNWLFPNGRISLDRCLALCGFIVLPFWILEKLGVPGMRFYISIISIPCLAIFVIGWLSSTSATV